MPPVPPIGGISSDANKPWRLYSMSDRTLIAVDAASQTVVVIFPTPTTQLSLSPEQAQAFGKALIEKALTLKLQQEN
jgi:hypothetical protein